mmetsp:Transcript_20219/g.44134  ORF Transcript_20219/g.44134 Transcript_20219/m.44134 type:complete len:404 (-) Transcript_20219:145-1356(-)
MAGLGDAFAIAAMRNDLLPSTHAPSMARSAGQALQHDAAPSAELRGTLSSQDAPGKSWAGLASAIFAGVTAGWAATHSRTKRKARAKVASAAAKTGDKMSLFSPAKVNLFLRIVGRRPDGYHDLASLFHTVSFGDTLDMEVLPTEAPKDELTCNLPGVPTDESNLVIRALNLFRKMSGETARFRLNLQKSTPAQAGMGGGSSNAAAALFGANALCGRPATNQDLIKWTEDPVIGSDATFFLSEGTAYCTGRGEVITPVGALPVPANMPIFLVKPRVGLSTPKVFKAMDLEGLDKTPPEELLRIFQEKGIDHETWVNDLETPAFKVAPELGELKQFLAKDGSFNFRAVLMSGSGSTIYAIGEPKGGEEAFKKAVKDKFNIEGIWRANLVRRAGDEWYKAPTASP